MDRRYFAAWGEMRRIRMNVVWRKITSSVRGLAVEVPMPEFVPGLAGESVVNCDGLYTVRRSSLSDLAGKMDDRTMRAVGRAVTYALGC